MVGAWSSYTGTFLAWFPLLIILVFGLPMLIAPMAWGRIIGFRLPDQTDLTVYFGRSLGVAISGLALAAYGASSFAPAQGVVMDGLILTAFLYVLTHVHGAVMRIQPLIETLEIAFFSTLVLLMLAVYPVGGESGLLRGW
jgi:ABC-type uncharacterized transport system permease subunit